jgi:hypothetical protein
MQEVPFYPSPAERQSRRAATISELSLDYGIIIPTNASYGSIALPFQRVLARLTRRDYVRLVGVAIGEHFDGLAKEAHKQMRAEIPQHFILLVADKQNLHFASYLELLSFWAIYARFIAKTPNSPAEALAGYTLDKEDFKEILRVEAYILVKKIQMLCHDFVEDMAILRQSAQKNPRGVTHIRYSLGYFGASLDFEEAFEGALLADEISTLSSVLVPLPTLCGQYKGILEERLAHFELACQHQNGAAATASALALHDISNISKAFGKRQKIGQNISVQASYSMRAGEAHIDTHHHFFGGKMLYRTFLYVALLGSAASLLWSFWAVMPLSLWLLSLLFLAIRNKNLCKKSLFTPRLPNAKRKDMKL